ncbi:N-acetylated-alpha-linked acidic dipeptidase 2-like [Amblyomma americanum]
MSDSPTASTTDIVSGAPTEPEPPKKQAFNIWPVAAIVGVLALVGIGAMLLFSSRRPQMALRSSVLHSASTGGKKVPGGVVLPRTTPLSARTALTRGTPSRLSKKPVTPSAKVEPSRDYMRRTLRFLAKRPHLSGTKYSETNIVDFIADEFRKHGLDTVEKVPYRILHQYPDEKNPNKVQLVDAKGKVLQEAKLQEDPVPGDDTNSMVPGYLSYARPGTVEAEVVYVGSGTYADVDLLEAHKIYIKGRICLARYGGGHRGGKIAVCQERGGVGTVLFLEPTLKGTKNFYPNSSIVDGTALQRGALFTFADPETPGYPSVDGVYRVANSSELPRIPALTVTYNFAKMLLEQLDGKVMNLSGGARRAGPFKGGRKLRLVVNNKWARPIVYDVIGTIRGKSEPDRYSIAGAHHDAWGFGAVDPSSATASLLEMSRILGARLKRGWRPRRTIVFAIWAAEEIAIAGSGEWVEEKLLLLTRGGVGYTNVDNCASGIMFFAYASPVLRNFLVETTKRVPFNGTETLYDYWYKYENDYSGTTKLQVYLTHGGMDNSAFNFLAGVPSAIFTFRPDKNVFPLGSYSAYHTAFETIRLYETLIDPTYHFMEMCARFNELLTVTLAEAKLLPYDFRTVAYEIQAAVTKLTSLRQLLNAHKVPIDWLTEEASMYTDAAQKWHSWLEKAKLGEDERRQVNDRMLLVERALLRQAPLEGRPTFRHLVFSPQLSNAYAGTGFPVVHDLAYRAQRLPAKKQEPLWRHVRAFINDACIALRNARILLSPDMAIPTGTYSKSNSNRT